MLRVAVIGLGYWGPNYARLLSGIVPGAELVACADTDSNRLQTLSRLYPSAGLYDDHKKLLATSQLDAAIIATPASAHRVLAEDCLAAGLHLLIEKPLASTAADAQAIVY